MAVLNHNRPAFYMITPKLFEALVEELVDRDLLELTRQRLARKDTAIEVETNICRFDVSGYATPGNRSCIALPPASM